MERNFASNSNTAALLHTPHLDSHTGTYINIPAQTVVSMQPLSTCNK